MKKIKQKAFYIKAALMHIFLIIVISAVSLFLWENKFYDGFAGGTAVEGSKDIAIVTIDDKSIETYRWPWKRSLYGSIVRYFNNYTNVNAIAFDSILTTLDIDNPEADKEFFDVVKQSPNFASGFMLRTSKFENKAEGEAYNLKLKSKFSINVEDKRTKNKEDTLHYKSIGMYPSEYFKALKNIGTVNIKMDYDGVLRNAFDLVYYDNTLYPSLGLRTYLLINDADKVTITDKYLLVDKTGLKIPIYSEKGFVKHYVRFNSFTNSTAYTHKQYSAVDIIESEKALREGRKPIINPEEFDNKTIFIGANVKAEATGLSDVIHTPVSLKHSGVDYQATVLDNYMNSDFIKKTNSLQNIAVIIFLSVVTFIIIRKFSFLISLLILIFLAVLYFLLCYISFKFGVAPLIITPLAAQLSTMIFGYSYRFILEGKNKEKIKQAMGKYLSQDIMQNVVKNIDDIRLGGKKANVTVLFADIRGFTSMSEKMTAEEVSKILNEYFSEIEPIITKYNGVINKFIGDAVMAIFGEPIQDINHPSNAVKCAYEMLKKVEWLQSKWINEGKPKIEIGIGINTGEAFVGNIGSEKRLEYTVIGDMVNLASRIESYNKVYKTNFLISSSTYSHVSSDTDVIKISEVTIRGKSKKMDIYEVLRVNNI